MAAVPRRGDGGGGRPRLARYELGEVTRQLYDAIWNEFCDWGVEFAKVRLADESVPAEAREATWWALVSALDTYLRLLHPVMPFITETLWGALPHRDGDPELLIVARWPGVSARDAAAEATLALIELIRGDPQRSRGGAAGGIRLAAGGRGDPSSLGSAFEGLRPALERLARARPLTRQLTREALAAATDGAGGLSVIAGETEAVSGRGGGRGHGRAGARSAREGAGRCETAPGVRPGSVAQRVVRGEGAAGRRRGRARPGGRARRPGGSSAGTPRPVVVRGHRGR